MPRRECGEGPPGPDSLPVPLQAVLRLLLLLLQLLPALSAHGAPVAATALWLVPRQQGSRQPLPRAAGGQPPRRHLEIFPCTLI